MTDKPHVALMQLPDRLDRLWVSKRPRRTARTKDNAIYRMLFDGRKHDLEQAVAGGNSQLSS